MRRAIAFLGVLLLAGACDPRKFDDLKDEAWVQIAERDDTETSGDFGTDVIALGAPAAGGARFVIQVGGSPGLAQITYDNKGSKTEQIGHDAEQSGRGALDPLDSKSAGSGLAPFGADAFLVGVKDRALVIKYDAGLKAGIGVTPTGWNKNLTGLAVASGNLGLGSATIPDVVATGQGTLVMIPDGDMTKTPVTCNYKSPNASRSPPAALQNLVVTKYGSSDHDFIIVTASTLANTGRILIIDPAAITQNDRNCPGGEDDVPGTFFNVTYPAPVAIAVTDLDGNSNPEIVAGYVDPDKLGVTGILRVYMNVSGTGQINPAVMDVTTGSREEDGDYEKDLSGARGARIVVANLDEDPQKEIVVSDPGALVDGVSAAGKVFVYHLITGTSTCEDPNKRGPLCLVRTLFDPDPSKDDYFGRAMTIAEFKGASKTASLLAVTQRAKLWVYFRALPSTTDPR